MTLPGRLPFLFTPQQAQQLRRLFFSNSLALDQSRLQLPSREQNTSKSTQKSNKMSEADQEWKPSGRPTSTMAQAFSASLDSAFSLDSDVTQLSQTIDQKKQRMIIQNRELEELQQRIREAEERLKARESIVPESSSKNAGQRDSESRSAGTPFSASRRLFGRDEQRGPQGTTTNSS